MGILRKFIERVGVRDMRYMFLAAILISGLLVADSARASITNGGFEDPIVTPGIIPGWTHNNSFYDVVNTAGTLPTLPALGLYHGPDDPGSPLNGNWTAATAADGS